MVSQCLWADNLGSSTTGSLQDCNVECSGNATESCGGSGNVLVYQDSAWVMPTRPSLGGQVQRLEEILVELVQDLQQWEGLLQQYKSEQSGETQAQSRAKAEAAPKRANQAVIRAGGVDILQQIAASRQQVLKVKSRYGKSIEFMGRVLLTELKSNSRKASKKSCRQLVIINWLVHNRPALLTKQANGD